MIMLNCKQIILLAFEQICFPNSRLGVYTIIDKIMMNGKYTRIDI